MYTRRRILQGHFVLPQRIQNKIDANQHTQSRIQTHTHSHIQWNSLANREKVQKLHYFIYRKDTLCKTVKDLERRADGGRTCHRLHAIILKKFQKKETSIVTEISGSGKVLIVVKKNNLNTDTNICIYTYICICF